LYWIELYQKVCVHLLEKNPGSVTVSSLTDVFEGCQLAIP